MTISRPIRAHISGPALLHNYRLAKRLAPDAGVWAVIKADAYGHGQWRAVEMLRAEADGFAVLECENAVDLRLAGISQPILLLEGVFSARDARAVAKYGLSTVIHCLEQLDLLLTAVPRGSPLAIHLKLNTGMNRLGLDAVDLAKARKMLSGADNVTLTMMTHFAEADGERGVDEQMTRFSAMTGDWAGQVSLANSAALLRYPRTHADWVRPGIMLYGSSPFAECSADDLGLQAVMALESEIIAVQRLVPGDRVGYGGAFVAGRPMRIGIVACGYADGYPRHAPSGTPVSVLGRMTETVGRVSMDMMACDLTDIPDAGIGAPVTLWGNGAAGMVAADAVARAAGTIAYELFCALAPRVPVTLVR
jgi:alanine racemase